MRKIVIAFALVCVVIMVSFSYLYLVNNKAATTQLSDINTTTNNDNELLMINGKNTPNLANKDLTIEKFTLENSAIKLQATADIGGRILSVQLPEHDNFLLLGDAVIREPKPDVNAQAYHINYMGHEMWVGPQSAWWAKQTENQQRFDEKSIWPPDPYLVLSPYEVITNTASELVLQGPLSSISGVAMRKSIHLDDVRAQATLVVDVKNTRTEPVSWDVWFNTRVYADTHVYVPVTSDNNIRVSNIISATDGPVDYSLSNGIFSLELLPPKAGKTRKHGKIFIQPSASRLDGRF